MKTAYLYAELDEEVYMEVPQGLKDVPKGHVLKLIKALYGLRQAGRQWYNTLRKVLEKFGMKRVKSDPHTFVVTKVINREKKTLIIPIYMNNLFPFGDKVLTDNFKAFIPNYFETTPPCNAHYFLGIRVTWSRVPWSDTTVRPYISLDQITFIEKVLTSIEEFYPEHTITNRRTVLPAAPIEPKHSTKDVCRSQTRLLFPVRCRTADVHHVGNSTGSRLPRGHAGVPRITPFS